MIITCIVSFIVIVIDMQVNNEIFFGEFKNKFKNNCICKLYIPILLCYRLALGMYASSNI